VNDVVVGLLSLGISGATVALIFAPELVGLCARYVTESGRLDRLASGASKESRRLGYRALECRALAERYESRGQHYEAVVLRAEAEAAERKAALRKDDAERYRRNKDDITYRRLTGGSSINNSSY
jgi:hypothetical protein